MFNAVRSAHKSALQRFQVHVLLLIPLSSAALAGCSGLVTANNGGSGSPPPLTISGVQAGTPTTSGFQVSWSTNLAANSSVDYGTTASYGSSAPTNSAMVTSHQVALTGLTPGTLYHFRARSTDASSSSTSSADMTLSTASDTTPPTVPTSLTATAISSSQINLSWTASTDNVGVTGYNVFRSGVKIGTVPGTSFQDSGLSASTSYTYNVSAFDTAGNTSARSAGASATTQAVSSGPAISGASVGSITTTGAMVSWTTDVVATSQVEYGTTIAYGSRTTLDSTLATSHSVALTGLSTNTLYHYRVRSKNSSGVESISGDFALQTNSVVDTTPPTIAITAPANGATVSGSVTVSANASDNVGVASVQFFLDGSNLGSLLIVAPYSVAWNTATASNGAHTLTAQAKDAAGNVGNAVAVNVTAANSTSTAMQDFQARCAQSGVIVCEGFDSASLFPGSFTPSTSNGTVMTQDATTARSGTSAHCVVPAQTGPDACGSFNQAMGQTFGQNSTFYVQYAQKIDANVLNQHPANTYFKQVIFASVEGGTCASKELTTVNLYDRDQPGMYSQCGGDTFQVSIPTNDFLLEQGDKTIALGDLVDSGFNCHYQTQLNGPNSCATYPPGVWVTYYYKVQIGTWGSPNSNIYAWRALPGQGYVEFIKITNHTLLNNEAGTGYDLVDLLNYYTSRNGSVAYGSTGNTWYDELIVSTQPIAAPAVPPELP